MLHCVSYENSAISKNNVTFPLKFVENCGRKNLLNILRQSHGYLATMTKLRSTYDDV